MMDDVDDADMNVAVKNDEFEGENEGNDAKKKITYMELLRAYDGISEKE